MNLYNMFAMRPMTAQGAASSVFGAGKVGPGAIAPVVPDVGSLFGRASRARSVPNASWDMDYVLGQAGVGLSGVGLGYLSGGQVPFFANYTMSDCALSNFKDQANYDSLKAHGTDGGAAFFTNIDYDPGEADRIKDNAEKGYAYLKNESENGNAAATGKFSQLDTEMKLHCKNASALADAHDDRLGCGNVQARGWSAQQQLWVEFLSIVSTMREFAQAPNEIPPFIPAGQHIPSNVDPGSYSNPVDRSYLTAGLRDQSNIDAAQKAQADAELAQLKQQTAALQSQGAATASSGMPSWLLPVGVLGAVGIAAFFIIKKRK